VREGRRTSFHVVPGKYAARAKSGDATCLSGSVTVKDGEDVPVTVTCSVK
jgi:hypothetical protein